MQGEELFIDLGHQRYAEIPVTVARPEGNAAAEQRQARRRQLALDRMRARVAQEDDTAELVLDLLILLGLADE